MRQKKCWFRISGIVAVFAMVLMQPAETWAGGNYKVLRRFKDGAFAQTGLISDAAGNLDGMTVECGSGENYYGVVFEVT